MPCEETLGGFRRESAPPRRCLRSAPPWGLKRKELLRVAWMSQFLHPRTSLLLTWISHSASKCLTEVLDRYTFVAWERLGYEETEGCHGCSRA